MHWFNREKQPEVWEVADDQPLGDIAAAHKIRDICVSAGAIAERLVAAGGRDAENKHAADAERYQAAIKRALEIATQISDDSMRDVSVSQVIKLCVQVDHLKTARVLLRAIRSEKTRAELVTDHPKLIDQDAAS
jgi:methylmalonyl-CoA mutase N-terminal domain/subunit